MVRYGKKLAAVVLLCMVLLAGMLPVMATETSAVSDTVSSGVSSVSSEEEASSELEFVHNEPSVKLPERKDEGLSPVGVIGWSAIFAAIIGVVIFVYTARAQDRRAFRSRSAARSRWQRHGPVRSGMSEKIHHDNSHMRR